MTGERIAALEAIAPSPPDGPARDGKAGDEARRSVEPDATSVAQRGRERSAPAPAPLEPAGGNPAPADRRPAPPAPPRRERTYEVELDLEL